jgi:hypothetical protein
VSTQVASVAVNTGIRSVGNVAIVRAVVGGLGSVRVGARRLVTVVGESVLDLVDDVRHDDDDDEGGMCRSRKV